MNNKNKRNLYYLGYYTLPENNEKRYSFLAGNSKIDYISRVLSNLNYDVSIISASPGKEKTCFYHVEEIDNNLKAFFLQSFRCTSFALIDKLFLLLFYLNLFFFLLFKLRKNDILIVYHSLFLIDIVKILKRIKKIKLIIECEEIYGNVSNENYIIQREMQYFNIADAYIFPTILLNQKINVNSKPFVLSHGTYHVEKTIDINLFNTEHIHCVYAGTFDLKKGCINAIRAALFLPENFHLHIIGFGTAEEISTVKNEIEKVSEQTSCKISYDGCYSGDSYCGFLQNCHIGLSTQSLNTTYNDTSFPSKILSYLANGLHVVSVKIPVLTSSKIKEYITFYEGDTPEQIATGIKNVKINDEFDGRTIVEMLHKDFINDMQTFLAEVNHGFN